MSIWHNSNEEPKRGKSYLLMFENNFAECGHFLKSYTRRGQDFWDLTRQFAEEEHGKIIAWVYYTDLIEKIGNPDEIKE